jgi:hypothetical protein
MSYALIILPEQSPQKTILNSTKQFKLDYLSTIFNFIFQTKSQL